MTQKLASLYRGRHVISAADFTKDDLENMFWHARDLKYCYKHENGRMLLRGYLKNNKETPRYFRLLFWEPSLRTLASFQDAIKTLGGTQETTHDAGRFSSVAKGESIAKTIRMIGNRCDGIIIRHDDKKEHNAVRIAADACEEYDLKTVIINAGDGSREHPTQALLDWYTIADKREEVWNGKKLIYGFVGDIAHSRTIHSLILLLAQHKFAEKMYFVCAHTDDIPQWLKERLSLYAVRIIKTGDIYEYANHIDIWYFTRYQIERKFDMKNMTQEERAEIENTYAQQFGWSKEWAALAKPEAIFLHPLPHGPEFPPDPEKPGIKSIVERDPRFIHLEQADNGFFVRMALLHFLFYKAPKI